MPTVADLSTPALVVDTTALAHNLDTMSRALPGPRLRPHVKAHKCTALAREQARRGHVHFTAATPSEIVGLARAGLGDDLLLANESVDPARLRAMANCSARITVAVDSEATVDAAAANGIREVLIDVNVYLPRCGCLPEAAPALADRARAAGLAVRGVMGYEGHAVLVADRAKREALTAKAMARLAEVADAVGGEVVSAGGTGTYDLNTAATEIQAGSYVLMDGDYCKLQLPFVRALAITATVIHVSDGWSVADCGLKALGMDHGNPTIDDADVLYCSDEHVTFTPRARMRVGDRVLVWPAHVDPTIAYHERMHLADGSGIGAEVVDAWPVDLRGWAV
ncbi:MAG TPA: alanine racemase [Acidimicrobiia bacterium]|nr:alanine racemase [Acidimicrobiia bacterium]